jgi:CRISPR system Cascade subunit CasA
LAAIAPFATSGGAGIRPSINGVPPVYVLPVGASLFATLLLNHVLPRYVSSLAGQPDPGPVWRRDTTAIADEERLEVGFAESLTWPARRARLLPGAGGTCSLCGRNAPVLVWRMVYAQGWWRSKSLPVWRDPWAAYVARRASAAASGPITPLRPYEDRHLWRDFVPLFLANEERAERPSVLNQIDSLLQEGLLPADSALRVDAFFVRTDGKMKVFEWRHDRFDFPPAVLARGPAAESVSPALEHAESVGRAIQDALCRIHPDSERGRPDWREIRTAIAHISRPATRTYWSTLEASFRRLIADPDLLGDINAQARWQETWWTEVRTVATRAFEGALAGCDTDANGLRRIETARRVFYTQLKKLGGER